MTRQAYGIGYSGRTMDELERIVQALDAVLVDIRFAPYSRNPAFRKASLQAALGSRYVHLGAFGNRNYQGGPVDIVDYEAGRAALEALERPALLMCMCRDPAACHRSVIMERLRAESFSVGEWDEPGVRQPRLL